MPDLAELLNYQEFSSVIVLLVLLSLIGSVMAGNDSRIHRGSQRVATAAAMGHFAALTWESSPRAAGDVILILIRALITGGLTLAIAHILLRVVVTIHDGVIPPLLQRLHAVRTYFARGSEQRRRKRSERLAQRRTQLDWEQNAPHREWAAREADERARQARLDQQRREAARRQCEMLFARHVADIGGRFPRAEFERFLAKHMRDDQPPDVVESCGQQLQAIICQHLDKVQPPPRFRSLQELAAWYAQQKQDIEAVAEERVRRTSLAQLNERYAEMTSRFLEEQHS